MGKDPKRKGKDPKRLDKHAIFISPTRVLIEDLNIEMDLKEYLAKKTNLRHSYKVAITSARKFLNTELHSSLILTTQHEGPLTQKIIRQMSWTHYSLMGEIGYEEYNHKVSQFMSNLPTYPAANSSQEVYHLTHFINAVLLCAFCPNYSSLMVSSQTELMRVCVTVSEDEEEQLEAKASLMNALIQLFPKKKKPTPLTSKEDKDIMTILKDIQTKVTTLLERE